MRSFPQAHPPKYTLGIGRKLLASFTVDGLPGHLFDVATQMNRGAELLVDHDEKVRLAVA